MARQLFRRRGTGDRTGFTLVELLVVIAIITILVALLVPALYFAVRRAKTARIALEVATISKALERYKLEYGEYPPDFADSAWRSSPAAKATRARELIIEHLQSIRRRRDVALDVPIITGSDVVALSSLNPANALYFWLSGLSANPEYPLMGVGERAALMDFVRDRLVIQYEAPLIEGRNQNGQPIFANATRIVAAEYYPAGDTQKRPFIYYNATSYSNTCDVNGNVLLPNNAGEPGNFAAKWAMQNPIAPPPYADALQKSSQGNPEFAEPQKFQIISAGLDSTYGSVAAVSNPWTNIQNYPAIPSSTLPRGNHIIDIKEHKDNVTSMTDGAIEDKIQD